jgi:hypothetical protein
VLHQRLHRSKQVSDSLSILLSIFAFRLNCSDADILASCWDTFCPGHPTSAPTEMCATMTSTATGGSGEFETTNSNAIPTKTASAAGSTGLPNAGNVPIQVSRYAVTIAGILAIVI